MAAFALSPPASHPFSAACYGSKHMLRLCDTDSRHTTRQTLHCAVVQLTDEKNFIPTSAYHTPLQYTLGTCRPMLSRTGRYFCHLIMSIPGDRAPLRDSCRPQ
ncbi:Protein IMPACT [Fusarium oxysporum f. sp. albedinis]|nr:Protein IMPACT [Fusarium oxysporum f. sp. albedinis]